MKVYHVTALAPTSRRVVVEGAFTAPRQQELVTATAGTLELYRLLPKESRLRPLFRATVFASIQALATLRLPATKRDFLLVTSDAGTLSILVADERSSTFKRVHCEALGKTGIRRIVPGQFLASDPRGRACMAAAFEKVKLCFILNRDTQEHLTISSALEANKSNTVTFAIAGVDVGFENPVFAALERSYERGAKKQLVYYELDLGLNHMSRKVMCPVRESTFAMIPVPGYQEGPSGVILIGIGHVTYCNPLAHGREARKLECIIPYRKGTDPCNDMVVSSAVYIDKKRKAFFFMMCTENGDLIKADIQWHSEEGAKQLRVAYFDTIPSPATSLSILRAGFLAVSMEGGDDALLRFESIDIDENDSAGGYSVSANIGNGDSLRRGEGSEEFLSETRGCLKKNKRGVTSSKYEFIPRSKLKNLSKAETHRTLTTLLDVHAARDPLGRLMLLTTSGRGDCGKFSVLRRGTSLTDISNQVSLPFHVGSVFTLTDHAEEFYHSYVIVSSLTQTLILRVHEGTIQEFYESGFKQEAATVFAGLMLTRSFVQVHTGGVRFLPDGNIEEATEWKPPANLTISAGCGNRAQLIVALSSGSLVYFEVDNESGRLTEADQLKDVLARSETETDKFSSKMNTERTASVAIQDIPPGRMKASFFAAADGVSNRVRLFRIKSTGSVEPLGLQVAPAPVISLSLVDFGIVAGFKSRTYSIAEQSTKERKKQDISDQSIGYKPMIYLVLGTSNGVVTRVAVDGSTGDLSSKRTAFIGMGPVRTAAFRIGNFSVCLLLGSQSAILHRQGERILMFPLLTNVIHHAAALSSPRYECGMVATAGASLRLMAFESMELFSFSGIPLSLLPPPLMPTKVSLNFSYQMDQHQLLGTPRRIVPIYKQSLAMNRRSVPGSASESRAIDLFVLLETGRRLREKEIGHGDDLTTSVKHSRGDVLLTRRDSSAATWHSTLQLFALNGGNGQKTVSGSSGGIKLSGSAVNCISTIPLPDSDRVLDGTCTSFGTDDRKTTGRIYIVVSVARHPLDAFRAAYQTNTAQMSGSLLTYALDVNTFEMSLLHDTALSEPAHAVTPFRDMIAVGCGRSLQLYSLGKKRLLKKVENRFAVKNRVVALCVTGSDTIFAGDVRESVTVYKYVFKRQAYGTFEENDSQNSGGKVVAIGSDSIPRWITSMVPVDYNTVVCGDKFGNLFVLRLSKGQSHPFAGDPVSKGLRQEIYHPITGGGNDKLVMEACVHLGSTVTSLTMGALRRAPETSGDSHDSAIIYATIDGSIGLLVPLQRESDVSLLQPVEAMMRKEQLSLCGRDHVTYRSCFGPVKNVIDGDLCEMFDTLTWEKKSEYAARLGRSVEDIVNKLDDLRWSAM